MLSTKGDPFGQATIEAMPVIMSLHQPVRTQTAVAGCPRSLRLVVRAEAQQSRGTIQKAREAIRSADLPAWARPAALTAVANALMALPAHAEAGKIFDFNLTLPLMAGQFLLLMVFLDKTWFGPVGRLLEERDAELRSKLGAFRDNSGELRALQEEAENALKEARKEAQAKVQAAKEATQAEQGKKLAEAKEKLDKELEKALAALEAERNDALKNLDSQVEKLSADILARVLPEGIKL